MMSCPRHPKQQVAGYCVVCGELGCEECVREHEGSMYCTKHFEPIQEELERAKKRQENRKRAERQRLVVHTREGRILYGTCLALNPMAAGFTLDLMDKSGDPMGKTSPFQYNDLKAIYYVKSFDGRAGQDEANQEPRGGIPMIVEFADGEVMQGYTMQRIQGNEARFHFIPKDAGSNNINVLVERAAIIGAYTPEEYKEKHRRELEDYLEQHRHSERPKEELLGDYHFERRDYSRGIKHYRIALKEHPDSQRIRQKIVSSEYNIGMRHIKYHQYEQALKCMEWVMNADPKNDRARRKAKKLRAHLTHNHASAHAGSGSGLMED